MEKDEFFSPHFTLAELTRSRTAVKYGIPNEPNGEQLDNLQALCDNVLEPARVVWDEPIEVTSAFRSPEVNRRVGGVQNSQHLLGQAADIRVRSPMETKLLGETIIRMRLPFDQLIFEGESHDETSCGWLHVSYRPNPRREVKHHKLKLKR